MSLPESVDPWRMVQGQRVLEAVVRVESLSRLVGLLAEPSGELQCRFEFGRDATGVAVVDVHAEGSLMLVCQRTLEPFAHAVRIEQRLGLIRTEAEEAALPEGTDPLLVEDAALNLRDVLEDEVILSLPLVPVSPGSEAVGDADDAGEEARPNPFAVLGQLKSSH